MDDVTKLIGEVIGRAKVIIERSPVENFARVLGFTDEIYFNPNAAKKAGFRNIPVPPTYPFVMEYWGKFKEINENLGSFENPFSSVFSKKIAEGCLLLHGEQSFIYHEIICVSDCLVGTTKIKDIYKKETSDKTMEFYVTQTNWEFDGELKPAVSETTNVILVDFFI